MIRTSLFFLSAATFLPAQQPNIVIFFSDDHNTIIIYASDQGFYLGEHGWYDKRWMYTESFRTPLIIQWKDASGNPVTPAGAAAEAMVQVMDIGPTVLEASGVAPATWRDGIEGDESFQTLVRDLMVELRDLRTQFNDTTGASFSIPEVSPPPPPEAPSFAKATADRPSRPRRQKRNRLHIAVQTELNPPMIRS